MNTIQKIDCCLIEWFKSQKVKTGLVQQLNCFHTQGAGIAKRIREIYPQVYDVDIRHSKKGDKSKLGDFCVAEVESGKFCYGIYGQYNYGYNNRFTSYDALNDGLIKVKDHAEKNNLAYIGIPNRMGCNLGGGSWHIVEAIIENTFMFSIIEVVICNYNP